MKTSKLSTLGWSCSERHFYALCFLITIVSTGICQTNRMADIITVGYNQSDFTFCVSWDLDVLCPFEDVVDVNVTSHPPPDAQQYYYSTTHSNYHSYDCVGHSALHPGQTTTVYAWANHEGGCDPNDYNYTTQTITLDALYSPVNVQATDGEFLDKVVVTWEKGTDRPDDSHKYWIRRNGGDDVYVNGDIRTYEFTGLTPGQTNTYTVNTVAFLQETTYYSPGVSDVGSTVSIVPEASDGEFYNKTKVTWNSLAHVADDIRLERQAFGDITWQELAILNKNATSYTDLDGVPGFIYTYKITPIWSGTLFSGEDEGFSRSNGKISGYVRSALGAGVDSVEIYIALADSISGGGDILPPNCATTYCTMTDPSGYYEVEDIYYYTGADFIVYPQKGIMIPHEFSPDSLTRNLNENYKSQSGVDFVDETVLTVGGRVTFPLEQGQQLACGVEGVAIMINGKQTGVFTDDEGNWSTTLSENGIYSFTASLFDHEFEDTLGQDTITLFINENNIDLNFEDKTLRTITVIAQGGCAASLGESVQIRITTPDNCINRVYDTDDKGLLTINDLPPMDDYSIGVEDIEDPVQESNLDNILDQLSEVLHGDLRKIDTMENIAEKDSMVYITYTDTLPDGNIIITLDSMLLHLKDTTYSFNNEFRFIYRSPLLLKTSFEDADAIIHACAGVDTIIEMVQGHEYTLLFNLTESFDTTCYIDTGTLVIYDEISDIETVRQTIPISHGVASYLVKPGIPDLTGNHEKYLYVTPEVDFLDADPVTYWVVVTGIKSNTPTFVTKTPELPQLVIHDPPGDNSFAFIEKGTTYTTTSSTSAQTIRRLFRLQERLFTTTPQACSEV